MGIDVYTHPENEMAKPNSAFICDNSANRGCLAGLLNWQGRKELDMIEQPNDNTSVPKCKHLLHSVLPTS